MVPHSWGNLPLRVKKQKSNDAWKLKRRDNTILTRGERERERILEREFDRELERELEGD